MLGRRGENPIAPLNLLADFGGGSLTCALGIMAALIERSRTGKGQIVDANMVEGAAYMGSFVYKMRDLPLWGQNRGEGWLDTGAHFYETYQTQDGKFMAVGALEHQFYAQLLQGLGWTEEDLPQFGGDSEEMKAKLAGKFLEKTRAEWTEIFEGLDACVTPVLHKDEAHEYGHNKERGAFQRSCRGHMDPVPAPR